MRTKSNLQKKKSNLGWRITYCCCPGNSWKIWIFSCKMSRTTDTWDRSVGTREVSFAGLLQNKGAHSQIIWAFIGWSLTCQHTLTRVIIVGTHEGGAVKNKLDSMDLWKNLTMSLKFGIPIVFFLPELSRFIMIVFRLSSTGPMSHGISAAGLTPILTCGQRCLLARDRSIALPSLKHNKLRCSTQTHVYLVISDVISNHQSLSVSIRD